MTGTSHLSVSLAGAPWSMVFTLALACLLVVLAQSALQALIPQDSVHRLGWWRSCWTHRTQHPGTDSSEPDTPPPSP
ncbi:hypothetical protein [Streptomyces sp. NPDC048200]|uniref:hypothetical protein n=1 Tax=Streptomyces sp. NPDC048200 TaxID=3365512 RepID=UPI003710AA85